jgi:hypothetical protein
MPRLLVAIPPGGLPEGFVEAVMGRAKDMGAELRALYPVDARWFGFSGSDRLTGASSRAEFDAYMRSCLNEEGGRLTRELSAAARLAGVEFSCDVAEGAPAEAALKAAAGFGADAIMTTAGYPELDTLEKAARPRGPIFLSIF